MDVRIVKEPIIIITRILGNFLIAFFYQKKEISDMLKTVLTFTQINSIHLMILEGQLALMQRIKQVYQIIYQW
jgi:ABC-type uncharacterized transport system permease subunit